MTFVVSVDADPVAPAELAVATVSWLVRRFLFEKPEAIDSWDTVAPAIAMVRETAQHSGCAIDVERELPSAAEDERRSIMRNVQRLNGRIRRHQRRPLMCCVDAAIVLRRRARRRCNEHACEKERCRCSHGGHHMWYKCS